LLKAWLEEKEKMGNSVPLEGIRGGGECEGCEE
jgi:hypothetical protein